MAKIDLNVCLLKTITEAIPNIGESKLYYCCGPKSPEAQN